MDDLSSIDWNAKAPSGQPPRPGNNNPFSSNPPLLKPNFAQTALTPTSPSRPGSALSGSGSAASPLKSTSPANDSFSNLLPTTAQKTKATLTLQDRQKQLLEERQRQIQEQQRRQAQDAQFLDSLGSGPQSSVARLPIAEKATVAPTVDDEDDILAAFKSSATVDKSSHFPPPLSAAGSGRSTPGVAHTNGHRNDTSGDGFDDDDDPFGLGSMPQQQHKRAAKLPQSGDDDVLGDLGRPVQPRKEPIPSPSPPARDSDSHASTRSSATTTPLDRAVAELVDMGFPADNARVALQETNGNVQAAVSFLLNQAHEEAKQKVKGRPGERIQSPAKQPGPQSQGAAPAWMKSESRSNSQQRRPENSPSGTDKDVSQYASEVGSTLFKSANSLWKAGRKQVQKAVADFQQDGDPNQPKWMRDASTDSRRSDSAPPQPPRPQSNGSESDGRATKASNVTDEALLLESGAGRPQRAHKMPPKMTHEPPDPSPLRGRSPAQALPERPASTQRFPAQPTQARPATKLSREQVEQQASQAYVSSARRRKPAATPTVGSPEPEVDLFSPAPARPPAASNSTSRPAQTTTRAPTPARPKVPPRTVPSVSPLVLSQSAQNRSNGTEAFKRGDYDTAHQAYSAALNPLPSNHPITIIVLSNRALTAIKTGDPKMAVGDADRALEIIGPSRGEGESIDLGAEGSKDMKDFYGKALMRKAEALETMEKWSDALAVWQLAIEAGAGGLVAVRGRDRCTKAANPAEAAPKPAARAAPVKRPTPARPKAATAASAEAVKKLREQNAAAEKMDDEKFALSDAVSARIEAWRGGKSDNLRALLSSMENVLWEGAGWKKVGMAELVMPNKVKIIYMKAIAKVHPDKIPQDANTEQRMISGSVFATLNEAWDKFKTANNI